MSELFRNFVFTLNNYTDLDIQVLLSYKCKYMLFAKEIAPTTGTPHLQGYCELAKRTRFNTLLATLPKTIHIEPRRGTQDQAINYIKEPIDKPVPTELYEVGEPNRQGTDVGPTALETARQLLTDNLPIDPMIHNIGVIKAYERISKYWPSSRYHSDMELSRIWIHGPGRSGKTSTAYRICHGFRTYKCDCISKGWFDGYDNHEAVILDDYEPDKYDTKSFKLLLSLLDKYPLRVEVKGSTVNWNPTTVIITSQHPPWHYYKDFSAHDPGTPEYWNSHELLRQLMGRLDEVIEIKGDTPVKYPRVGVFKDVINAEGASVVLPSNFRNNRNNTCQDDIEERSYNQDMRGKQEE
jgi:hypothetical protein